jgi:DNA-binding NarL/FixJ family response regulator
MITNKKIRVVIADDHEIFREGLVMLISSLEGVELLGAANDGVELMQLVKKYEPDVVLTDIKMPNKDGIEATKEILQFHPATNVIALSMYDEGEQIIEMIEAGGMGYLVKDASKKEMNEAINTVYANKNYYCKHTTSKITQLIAAKGFNPTISRDKPFFKDIELEIIKYLSDGLTSKEIGNNVNLSYRTVEGYRLKIQEKMDVNSTAGIIKYALKNKLIS